MSTSHHRQLLQVQEAIPLLRATPATLRSLLLPLPSDWLDFQEEPDAWSPRTVVVHFIQNERTNWIPRATIILAESDDRRFPEFQQLPPAGAVFSTDIRAMIEEFSSLRDKNLTSLSGFNLGQDDYLRTGEHPSLGTVTLGQLLATWVVHDLNHTYQILKTLAKLQITAVGPWRKFLGILEA